MTNATPQLPKFMPDEPCRKCGSMGPALKWTLIAIPPPRRSDLKPPPLVEVLEVTCWRCGAQWLRAPLDAEGTPQEPHE